MKRNDEQSEAHAVMIARNTTARYSWEDRVLCDRGDLLSEAMLAAVLACRSHDPARGAWRTHIITSVHRAIKTTIRNAMPLSRTWNTRERAGETVPPTALPPVSLDALLTEADDEGPITLAETSRLPHAPDDPEEQALAAIEAQHLRRAVAHLPAPWRHVIVRCYWHDTTHQQAGAEIGRSESRAHQYHRDAIQRLRRTIAP